MATAIGYGDVNSNDDSKGDGNGDSNGDCNGDGNGDGNNDKGRVASSCAGNVRRCGRGKPCLHPHGHKGKCIHQRCVMGVTLLRVFAPFQGGEFLTDHHGLFFVYILQLLF
jgi:hypothetical protein